MSSPMSPSGRWSAATICVSAPASGEPATTKSAGRTIGCPELCAAASACRATSRLSSSTRDVPVAMPCARRKVKHMAPPISTSSASSSILVTTPTLSETLAPPSSTTNGRAGSVSRPPRARSSASMSRPATAGSRCATPSVEAWARWAAPKASLTYTSASCASWAAKAGSLAVSSGWKRRFSSSVTSPGFIACTAAVTCGPTQSSSLATGRPSSSASRRATGSRRRPSTT